MSNSEVIRIERLTKEYPETVAVDGISFTVSRGEVVGFLGPNGAGKTTTLKMLTCFLPATAGHATVAGHDIATQSLQVRQSIGYLPETNALYEEMRVSEYLRFRAALKKVPWSQRRSHVADALQLCGLTHVAQRIIGQLSKGYRQRVGLADTLVGKPPVIILDEPTSGLDPQQIVEVRELIKSLGQENTILLSTHHLPEVEHICDRVVIIHQGRIVLDDTLENLHKGPDGKQRTLEEVFIEATGSPPPPGPTNAEDGEEEEEQDEEEREENAADEDADDEDAADEDAADEDAADEDGADEDDADDEDADEDDADEDDAHKNDKEEEKEVQS